MALKIGDRVEYKGETIDGKCPQGKIIDIFKNKRDFITGYAVRLDAGMYVQFKPTNLKWRKLDD